MAKEPNLVNEELAQAQCDLVVTRAAELMTGDFRAPIEMVVDRFVTYAVAQTASTFGKAAAVQVLRQALANVEAGALDDVDGAQKRH